MAPFLEICVDNFESIQAAVNGGAKRIELCSSLKEGGLTPSYGFFQIVKKTFGDRLKIFPMIRPRGGDFCYSHEELQIMAQDIETLKMAGADGFVFGCLRPDGSIDIDSNKFLIAKATPLDSFDMANNPEKSLEDIINIGFKRILTSGQRRTAFEGLELIVKLVKSADGRIIIMPGSGINPRNLAAILTTGAVEYHCSASTLRQSSMIYRNESLNMGNTEESSDYIWKVSSSEQIQQLINIAKRF